MTRLLPWLLLLPLLSSVLTDDSMNNGSIETMGTSNDTTSSNKTTDTVFVAGILDTDTYEWAESVFRHTVAFLNNRTDGFHDDIFEADDRTTLIEHTLVNDQCDETEAVRAYWNVRRNRTLRLVANKPKLHGIVGSRCSGASIALARLSGLEGIPQVSPVSTSAELSDDDEFPYFSRLVAPGTMEGEVGALLSLLGAFGWERVAVLATDTQYAQDIAAEFRKWTGVGIIDADGSEIWKGQVSYANTISLLPDTGEVDADSVRQTLREIPTSNPSINSRVVVLIAQEEHAFPILKIAHDMTFQKDTIWVGVSSWIGRESPITTEWLTDFPGYLGVALYRNRDQYAQNYLDLVRDAQAKQGEDAWVHFPHDAVPYVVDSIVALAKALSMVTPSERANGTAVTMALRNLMWEGVSGPVQFSTNGDRANPQYTIFNFQKREGTSQYQWVDLGSTGTSILSASLTNGFDDVCFANVGCGVQTIPSDRYPVPKERVKLWVCLVIPVISIALIGLAIKNCRHEATLSELQKKLANLDDEVDDAIEKRNKLILARGALIDKPDTWSSTNTTTLVEVNPCDDQYWDVTRQMQETMPDAHIAKLWRVQNTALWSYYSFHKHRLALNGIDTNELAVWHGTSRVDPKVIYDDTQDGFMMQYSNDGFWGRGIYFAKKSEYSHSYAFRPSNRPQSSAASDGRLAAKHDEREMFLTKLLVGNAMNMNRDESAQKAAECRALTVPPTHPTTNLKYNTVTGHTGGSQVWIVYENGRAYPDFLVRYYRGSRDPLRTPWATKEQAQSSSKQNGAKFEDTRIVLNGDMVDLEAGKTVGHATDDVVWEFLDTNVWKPYSALHQNILEKAHMDPDSPSSTSVNLQSNDWAYQVDLINMVQTNVEHSNRTQRDVRRRVLSEDATV